MSTPTTQSPFAPPSLAPHVLRFLLEAQLTGARPSMTDVAVHLSVRRTDVRATLSALHQQDLYDCVRGRLTLRGFAAAMVFRSRVLPAIRRPRLQAIRAA